MGHCPMKNAVIRLHGVAYNMIHLANLLNPREVLA